MDCLDAKSASLVPKALVLHKSFQPGLPVQQGKEIGGTPKFRAFVKRLSLPKHSIQPSLFHQADLRRTGSLPWNLYSELGSQRARHVPIIITQQVIDVVLKTQPDAEPQGGSTNSGPPSSEDLNTEARQARRPRYRPIVIPAFAQPYSPLPPSPPYTKKPRPPLLDLPAKAPPTPPLTMSRPTTSTSRTSTLDSNTSPPTQNQVYVGRLQPSSTPYLADMARSQSSLNNDSQNESSQPNGTHSRPARAEPASFSAISMAASGHQLQMMPGTNNLSGMVCNVYKCTGKEPHALVGATTTILGDKLYVFGGRRLSRRRQQLANDLYELDLIRRHWTKVETSGNIPAPRYFHSVCALGDTKLVCYGGMSPSLTQSPNGTSQQTNASDTEVVVMSDIHIYDILTKIWIHVPSKENPQGRYAHCATILPSSGVFASSNAPLSAIHHNPSSSNPNQGTIGVALDGTGGAEMLVVGGQDSANSYIEQISVFNLRSLTWTATNPLGKFCGAYRSVVAPLVGMPVSRIGKGIEPSDGVVEASDPQSSMLIYSNYNFLDVKLELQVRMPDGTLVEKPMLGQFSPPGLRFPNGDILDNHFVVSGTYLTSAKHEYALWALDLRTMTWSRIDVGGSIFSQGSWNRGVLWPRRNTFVILGSRKRSLVEDYNHRRINFSNVCLVELESFGLYENPRRVTPTSGYNSFSAPILPASLAPKVSAWTAGGRPHPSAATELGRLALGFREITDMDIVAVTGERIPVNSHLLARRWGPYFISLLREGASSSFAPSTNGDTNFSDNATLRAPTQTTSRNSSITITPSVPQENGYSSHSHTAPSFASTASTLNPPCSHLPKLNPKDPSPYQPPTPCNVSPSSRSRTLFLPHTPLTIHAMLNFLYTSSLPPPSHSLSTPQILCSLLQLARPYRIDGLLEAVVERLHQVMDERNAAAVFNASAMAAGGGRGTGFDKFAGSHIDDSVDEPTESPIDGVTDKIGEDLGRPTTRTALRIDTSFSAYRNGARQIRQARAGQTEAQPPDSEDDGSTSGASTRSGSSIGGSDYLGVEEAEEVWSGEMSCVIGLQKRGLRGLMEGRRMRERGRSLGQSAIDTPDEARGDVRVGLGIA
ncbi:MAG: hypothetical protein MMC33_001517 [Icmadophila ericetorum]|nr:hypothetical protein [Icmadophila ericetorum]